MEYYFAGPRHGVGNYIERYQTHGDSEAEARRKVEATFFTPAASLTLVAVIPCAPRPDWYAEVWNTVPEKVVTA